MASIKVGRGVKAESELVISGTMGYVYVLAPWWKTEYFEIRREVPPPKKLRVTLKEHYIKLIMELAPILIPTLNRYEHLKKCLESLSRCSWADQTEVYVALDYPPSEKYVEGWKKNKEFLENCGNMGFKKLHLIKREENYGIWNPGDKGNLSCLLNDIIKSHDRFIITEDDNIFSPAFLEYMNKGFERYKDDDSVFALCGYRYFADIKHDENTFFKQNVDICGWGLGLWKSKLRAMTYEEFRKRLSLKTFLKVYRRAGIEKAIYFLNCCHNRWDGHIIDMVNTILCIINDQDQIMPTVSLVKNIGFDESSQNFRSVPDYIKQKFDGQLMSEASHFDFIGTGYEYYEENQRIYKDQYPNKLPKMLALKRLIKALVKVVLYR